MTFSIIFQLTVKMSEFLITYSKLSRQQLVEEGLLEIEVYIYRG